MISLTHQKFRNQTGCGVFFCPITGHVIGPASLLMSLRRPECLEHTPFIPSGPFSKPNEIAIALLRVDRAYLTRPHG